MSQFVKGKCPLCGSGVFVASGDWLTCSGSTCPDPTFVSEIFAWYSDARAQLATLEARVERAKAFVEMTRNDHGFDCVAAKPLLAILEGDTE